MSLSREVTKIIRAGYANEQKQSVIANALNEAGLKTPSDKEWSNESVSNYARKKLGLRRNRVYTKTRTNAKGNGHTGTEPEIVEVIREIVTSNLTQGTQSALLKRLMR